jgi:(p)ppGpp synthase/HD superfamily hydrolase
MLSSAFVRAVDMAVGEHLEDARKGSGVPYLAHVFGVCSLVLEEGGSEAQAIAALLHDVPEDKGGRARLEEIRGRFGDEVAGIVEACSDSLVEDGRAKEAWWPRKQCYLADLGTHDPKALLVSLADKVYNARAILADYRGMGEEVWSRFKAGRDGQLWYYRQLVPIYRAAGLRTPLVAELERTVAELEQLVAARAAAVPTVESDEAPAIRGAA